MYSSVKFLSPIVTAGLPTPGPVAAAGGLVRGGAVIAPPVFEPELDDELPHAASAATVASASAPASARVRFLRIICSSWID